MGKIVSFVPAHFSPFLLFSNQNSCRNLRSSFLSFQHQHRPSLVEITFGIPLFYSFIMIYFWRKPISEASIKSVDFPISVSPWHNISGQYGINWNLLLTVKPKDGNLDVSISTVDFNVNIQQLWQMNWWHVQIPDICNFGQQMELTNGSDGKYYVTP